MALFASDAIWTWYNHPVSTYLPDLDCTVVGWVDNGKNVYFGWYYHATGILQIKFWSSTISDVDDHDNPAHLYLDPAGSHPKQLLAGYSEHAFPTHTTNINSYTRLAAATKGNQCPSPTETTVGTTQTYVVFYQIDTTSKHVYWFFRDGATGAGNPSFRVSANGGDTWGADTAFVDGAGKGPYIQSYHLASSKRIDFLVTTDNPNLSVSSVYHLYMTYDSSGNRNWFKSDGTQIGTGDSALPIPLSSMTLVYDGTTTNSWIWDICWIGGTLTAAITTFASNSLSSPGIHYYNKATLTSGTWSSLEQIADGGGQTQDYLFSAEPHYSGGISLDPSNANKVILSRKYGTTDFRMEVWEKSAGTWSKTVDVSGNTANKNARPMRVRGRDILSLSTQWFYWRGTYTSAQSYTTDVHSYPDLTINTTITPIAKPASPAWQTDLAPAGNTGYWPFTDGTGTTLTDYNPTPHNGTLVGALTWGTGGTLDPEISGFSATKYITADGAAGQVYNGTYPCGMIVMFKGTNTSDAVLMSLGSSSDTNPVAAIRINETGAGRVSVLLRDDAGGGPVSTLFLASQTINDGVIHTIALYSLSATDHNLYLDGVIIAKSSTSLGTLTCNQLTFGALRRTTVTLPCNGSLFAAAIFSGAVVIDPGHQSHDWKTGQFEAIRAAATGGVFPHFIDNQLAGFMQELGGM